MTTTWFTFWRPVAAPASDAAPAPESAPLEGDDDPDPPPAGGGVPYEGEELELQWTVSRRKARVVFRMARFLRGDGLEAPTAIAARPFHAIDYAGPCGPTFGSLTEGRVRVTFRAKDCPDEVTL